MIYVRGAVIVLAAVLCVIGASAQVPDSVDPKRQSFGKQISWGVSVREAYDDNYLGRSGNVGFPIEASWVTTFSPTAAYSFNIPETDLAARYSYSANLYSSREAVAGGKIDQAHDFRLDLTHMFSQRLRMHVIDVFNPGFQPQIDEGITQFNGNYIQNTIDAQLDYELSSRLTVSGKLSHYFIEYDNPTGTQGRSVAPTMNRESYGGTGILKYRYSPDTSASFFYGHNITMYDLQTGRDSQTDTVGLGFDHNFGPRLTTRLNVGVDATDYDSKGSTQFNPDISFVSTYMLSPRSSAAFTFYTRAQPTELQQYLSQTVYSMSFALMHQFTARLLGTASITYVPATYDIGLTVPQDHLLEQDSGYGRIATRTITETTTALGLNLNYQVNPHVTVSTGVSFTQVQSESWHPGDGTDKDPAVPDNRSYTRTLTYVQLSVGF